MKKIVLCALFMLLLSSTALAFEPDKGEWTWRYSTDDQSIYSYNAPPELVSVSKDKNYIEITGHILSVLPYNSDVAQYQSKIKVGIKIREKQMWISYLQQVAYDKNNKVVPLKPNPKSDNWHAVLHSTAEEGYGLALFQAFKEYVGAGHYDQKDDKKLK